MNRKSFSFIATALIVLLVLSACRLQEPSETSMDTGPMESSMNPPGSSTPDSSLPAASIPDEIIPEDHQWITFPLDEWRDPNNQYAGFPVSLDIPSDHFSQELYYHIQVLGEGSAILELYGLPPSLKEDPEAFIWFTEQNCPNPCIVSWNCATPYNQFPEIVALDIQAFKTHPANSLQEEIPIAHGIVLIRNSIVLKDVRLSGEIYSVNNFTTLPDYENKKEDIMRIISEKRAEVMDELGLILHTEGRGGS